MNELFESSYLSIMSAENDKLRKQLQQKENIIKEAREYLEIFTNFDECTINGRVLQKAIDILDKEGEDNE